MQSSTCSFSVICASISKNSKMFSMLFVTKVIVILTLSVSSLAVDLDGAKESPCFEVKKTVPVNMEWIMSQKTFYYPLMNRLDLYLVASRVTGKEAKDLREDELYYESCLTFETEGENFVGTGFHGKKQTFNMEPVKGDEVFAEYNPEGKKILTCYHELSDNKTFTLSACCVDELDQMTWGVLSNVKRLPEKTVNIIHDHLELMGFKREFFTSQRYDHCKLKEAGQDKKNEL